MVAHCFGDERPGSCRGAGGALLGCRPDGEPCGVASCGERAALSGTAGGSPLGHPLAERATVDWDALRCEIILAQGRDESQAARELYASFRGSGARFHSHAASKQCVFALVGAGLGIHITLATTSQSGVRSRVWPSRVSMIRTLQFKLHWFGSLDCKTPPLTASWRSHSIRCSGLCHLRRTSDR